MREKIFNFVCFLMFRSLAKDLIKDLRDKASMNIYFAAVFEMTAQEMSRDDDARQPQILDIADLRLRCDKLRELATEQEAAANLLLLGRSFRAFRVDPSFWSECKAVANKHLQ